jgi:hypothetical protein
MSRILAVIVVLSAAACSPPPPVPSPIQRGAALFAPAAANLGRIMAAELKARDEKAFQRYIQESGGKDESDLVRKVESEVLSRYADAFSVSAAMEAELKAGKFDDAWNHKRMNKAIGIFADRKLNLPEVCRVAIKRVQSGDWKSGLELEFTARMLEGEILMPKIK